jgi:peptidoglycan/xylan/chitin deacetylase (PgdA/CDA1 family)
MNEHWLRRVSGARERGRWAGPSCALTFDDGPDPLYTPQVLDELARLGAVATFFVVGAKVQRHPELVRRMLAEGHRVGSHSQTHRTPWDAPGRLIAADYAAGRRALERVTGTSHRLFRPPYGWLSLRTACWIRANAPNAWIWSVDPDDWRPEATTEAIARTSERLGPGDVMLLHDGVEGSASEVGQDRRQTVAAVARIVEAARSRGLSFVTLPA